MDIQLNLGNMSLTNTATNSVLVILCLIIFFIICGMKIKKADPTEPSKGFMAVMEVIYQALSDFTTNSIGEKGLNFVPFVITAAAYLAIANLVGLIGLVPPTTDINITVALAIITLTYITFSGIFTKGLLGYMKDTFIGDVGGILLILFIPINIVGEISKIISLAFRLFGNIVSGAVLIGLLSGLIVGLLSAFNLGTPFGLAFLGGLPIVNAYFDVFAGLMQTFVFCTITTMWMRSAVEQEG